MGNKAPLGLAGHLFFEATCLKSMLPFRGSLQQCNLGIPNHFAITFPDFTTFPMVFPWFYHGFPVVFPWFSHGFPRGLRLMLKTLPSPLAGARSWLRSPQLRGAQCSVDRLSISCHHETHTYIYILCIFYTYIMYIYIYE